MAKNLILKVGIKGARKTTGALKSVGSAVTSIGIKAGIATAGFGAFSTKLAGDFQKSLLEVSTLLNKTTSKDLDTMSRELRAVAISSGVALDSLAKAKYDIVSAGFSNAADSAKVLGVSSKLAVGGVTSVAEAADLLTTSLNALGLDASETEKVADQLFTTVRLGKTTMTELSASLGQVLPFARSAGLGLGGVGAAMATLTASGISTAQATTSLRATLVSLQSPADSSKKAMKEAGIEIKRFDDGTLDLVSTIQQFQGIDPDTLKKIIPRVEAILGIQTMAQNFTTLTSNVEEFATKTEGATEQAFNKMASGFNQQMSMLKNSIQAIMIEIGNVIIEIIQPKIEEINGEFAKLGEIGFDNLGKSVRENIPVIMDALVNTMSIAFNQIEKRSKLMGLTIKEHISDAMPFIEGDFEKLEGISQRLAQRAEQDAVIIAQMFRDMYAQITEDAESHANDDFDLSNAIVEDFESSIAKRLELRRQESENIIAIENQTLDAQNTAREGFTEKEKERMIRRIQTEQLFFDATLSAHDQFINTLTDAEMHGAERRKVIQEAFKNAGIRFIGEHTQAFLKNKLLEISIAESSNNVKMIMAKSSAMKEFLINQGKNIAGVLADGAKIVSGALASMGPFALIGAPAIIAAVGALTGSLISQIKSGAGALGFADGGLVPGTDRGQGDTVPAMLTPGEIVLNQAQQENIATSMGTINVNITGNVVGTEEFVRDALLPEISRTVRNELA